MKRAVLIALLWAAIFTKSDASQGRDRPLQGDPIGLFPQTSSVAAGQFGYSIPIEAAPGRGGMEPSLALDYSSARQHGMTGFVGWRISGLSQIIRCPRIMTRDFFTGGVNYNDADAFCLDGVKLIAAAATNAAVLPSDIVAPQGLSVYGAFVPEDRTANVRVIAFADSSKPSPLIQAWVVLQPDKRYRWYGETANARIAGTRRSDKKFVTLGWLLSGDVKNFNRIDFQYVDDPCKPGNEDSCSSAPLDASLAQDQGARYLQTVSYTRWTGPKQDLYGGPSTIRKIQFNWNGTQPANYRDAWINGVRLLYTRQLRSIDVFGPSSQKIRTYRLQSGLSLRSGRSLLKSVTVCDPTSVCYPPTTFTYSTTDIENTYKDSVKFTDAYEFPLGKTGWTTPSGVLIADVTGDGFDDILYVNDPTASGKQVVPNESYVAPSSGTLSNTTYTNTIAIPFFNFQGTKVFDANLDLKPDFMYSSGRYSPSVAYWTPGTISTYGYDAGSFPKSAADLVFESTGVLPATVHVDLDGDQKQELVAFKTTPEGKYVVNIYALQNNGNPSDEWTAGFHGWKEWDANFVVGYGGGIARDINGDGKMDFVFYDANKDGAYLSIDDSGAYKVHPLGFDLNDIYFVDVNGDHLPDALKLGFGLSTTIRLNTGDGFTNEIAMPGVAVDNVWDVRVADFNEDGREDLLLLNTVKGEVAPRLCLSNGSWFNCNLSQSPPFPLALGSKMVGSSPSSDFPDSDFPQWSATSLHGHYSRLWQGIQLLDANNDGLPEILSVAAKSNVDFVYRILAQKQSEDGVYGDILVGVENGLGHQQQVKYANLSQVDTACSNNKALAIAPLQKCIRRGVVVKEYLDGQPSGGFRSRQYKYEGARIDMHGLGFIGFSRIVEWDPTAREETTYEYDLQSSAVTPTRYAYPLAHLVKRRQTVVKSDAKVPLYTRTVEFGRSVMSGSDGTYRSRLDSETFTEILNKQQNKQRTLKIEYAEHDAFGYPTAVTQTLGDGAAVRHEVTYQHNPTQSLFGLVVSEKITYMKPGSLDIVQASAAVYGPHGELLQHETEPAAADPELYALQAFTYDAGGLLQHVERSNKSKTLVRYRDLFWSTDGCFVNKLTNELSEATVLSFSAAFGSVTSSTDSNGRTATFSYDTFGRLRQQSYAEGGSTQISYAKINDDLPLEVTRSDSSGTTHQERFDQLLRPTERLGRMFDGTAIRTVVDYDALGRISQISNPMSTLVPALPKPVAATTLVYDDIGVLTSVKLPDGSTVTTSYDGFGQITETDETGRQIRTTLDAASHITKTEWLAPKNIVLRTLNATYDAAGRLTQQFASQSELATRTYDIRGRLLSFTDGDGGSETWQWNAVDDVVEHRKKAQSENFVTSLSYDAAGRLVDILSAGNAIQKRHDHLTYGKTKGLLGLLTATQRDNNGDGVYDSEDFYSYDAAGRLSVHRSKIDGTLLASRFEYDTDGRIGAIDYPEINGAAKRVQYHYNSAGFLARLTIDGNTPLWEVLSANLSSIKVRYGQNIVSESTFDPVTALLQSETTTVGPTQVYNRTYAYTPDRRIATTTDGLNGVAESVTYDSLSRLQTWSRVVANAPASTVGKSWSYDDTRSGVLKQVDYLGAAKQVVAKVVYSFDSNTPVHAVKASEITPVSPPGPTSVSKYSYDAFGREITKATDGATVRSTATINRFELPEVMTAGGHTLAFLYDAAGARVAKQDKTAQTSTLYQGKLYQRITQPSQTVHILQLFADNYVGRLVYDTATPGYHMEFTNSDQRGSTELVLDDNGKEIARSYFDPSGAMLGKNGMETSSTQDRLPRFADHELDSELGTFDMGARFYDPSTRRFTGPDPVFLGFDRYAYASNDPVNRTDPDGRCDELSYWFCDWPGYGGFGTWFQSWDSEGPPASSGPIGSNGGGGVILSPGAGPGHAHNVIENRVDSTTDYLWDAARSTTDCKNSNCHVYDRSKHHASLNWERFKPLTAGEMVNFLVTGFGEALFGGSAANAPSTEDVLLGRVENSLSEEEQIWNSTKFWAVWYLPVGSMVRYAGRLSFAEAPSVFLYRTMSREQLDLLLDSGALAGGKENFLSMNAFYSQALYRGAVVEFRLAPEALDELATMGVRNNARLTQLQFGELSLVSKGWTQSSVFFKAEGPLVNIGVGQGAGLEAFNNLIRGIRVIEP